MFTFSHSAPEAQLHPAEERESCGNPESQRNGRDTRASEQVHDRQQQEAQANRDVPPSPVS